MSEVIITPDYDGLYDDWFDPPMEIKMKMNEDIVINTTEGLEVVTVPQSLHEIAYDFATKGITTTINTTSGSEIFNVPHDA
mgnify:FL=1|tara:strand:- start:10 stop:252 length:243 start_codon:yes stop_codon:yes gene_type:complete